MSYVTCELQCTNRLYPCASKYSASGTPMFPVSFSLSRMRAHACARALTFSFSLTCSLSRFFRPLLLLLSCSLSFMHTLSRSLTLSISLSHSFVLSLSLSFSRFLSPSPSLSSSMRLYLCAYSSLELYAYSSFLLVFSMPFPPWVHPHSDIVSHHNFNHSTPHQLRNIEYPPTPPPHTHIVSLSKNW